MSEIQIKIRQSLSDAVATTFEEMAFEMAVPMKGDENYDEFIIEKIHAVIHIISPVEGKMAVILSSEYAKSIAENIIAQNADEITPELVNDMLGEILNTIAGNYMKNLTHSSIKFELGLPHTGEGAPQLEADELESVTFRMNGEYMIVKIYGEGFIGLSESAE
ncbi:MAG: chemotaxis protein CheX [FCB group bacterium]|nr:chemotaxis protein CheX [FCB group bacterium]